MSKYQDELWVPVAAVEDLPVLLNTAMVADGWQPGSSNVGQKLMTGKEHRQESDESFVWDFNFELILRWAPKKKDEIAQKRLETASASAGESGLDSEAAVSTLAAGEQGHLVFIQVSESKSRSEHRLQRRAEQFKQALLQEAEVLLATGHPKPNPDIYPSARFSTQEELRERNYLDSVKDHRRFIIGKIGEDFLSIPAREANRHVLISGPTGTGKSRSVFAPNIIERTGVSMIVTEATAGNEPPHLYKSTAGWRAANGHAVKYFNPDDLFSDQINPLDMISTDRDARMVCELIMRTTTQKSHKGDQYWDTSERMLLTALLLHVCGFREEGVAHLGHVVELVNRSEADLKRIAKRSPVLQAYNRFEAFFSRGTENTRNIVMSCLGQRLDLWNDTRTVALTKETNLDLEKLKEGLFTFYIVLSAEKEEFRPLAILVWHYILHMISNNRFKYPVSLMLDEFANLGYVRGMKEKLSLFRHLDIGVVLGVQDHSQVEIVYEKEAAMFFSQPTTKLFFTPNEFQKAKPISEMLGETTLIDPEVQGGSVRYQKIQRPLLSPEQILNPRISDQLIVFLPKARPLQISHIPWNAYNAYEENYPLPPRQPLVVDESLKMRFPDQDESEPLQGPWDPMDPKMADLEKQKRSESQVSFDLQQEAQFKQDEALRVQEQAAELDDEVRQLEYYNNMKAHLSSEISGGLEMAKSLLSRFEADLLELMAANKNRHLSDEEKETQEVAGLKVRIMKDIVDDMQANRVQQNPDPEYPLPWQK